MGFKKLLILCLILHFCFSMPGNGGKDEDIERQIQAYEKQEKAQKQFKKYKDQGQIKETITKIGTGKKSKDASVYEPVVEKSIGKLKVHEFFRLLQHWGVTVKNHDHSFIKLKIGGELYTFRIYLAANGNNQILINNKDGNAVIAYKQFLEKVKELNLDVRKVAKYMLEASKAPLNDKSKKWNSDYKFLNEAVQFKGKSVKMRELANEILVVGQVAEAAKPSNAYMKEWKKGIREIKRKEIEKSTANWEKRMVKAFKEFTISPSAPKEYKKIFELAAELNKPHESTIKDILKGRMIELMGDLPGVKSNKRNKFVNKLIENAAAVVKTTRNSFVNSLRELVGVGKLSGRVPGMDVAFRGMLEEIVNLPESAITDTLLEDYFKHFFSISIETKYGRFDMTFNNYISSELAQKTDAKGRKRNRLDPVGASRGDDTKRYVTRSVKQRIESGCDTSVKKRSVCTDSEKWKIIEDSITLEEHKLTFETINEEGGRESYEVDIDVSELSTTKFVKERMALVDEYFKDTLTRTDTDVEPTGLDRVNQGLNAYGLIVNLLGSVQYFSRGEYGKGAFSMAQLVHSLGGLEGIDKVLNKLTDKVLDKVMSYSVEKIGLTESIERLSNEGEEALGETASKLLKREESAIPYVGLAFDFYFIQEDIEDLKNKNSSTPLPLKIAHLTLDVSITVLSLVDAEVPVLIPFIEPLVVALTIVRISIDDFYTDILYEMQQVKGKPFIDQVNAFLKGFNEGKMDVLTLGLSTQMRSIKKLKEYDDQLLRQFSDPTTYFNVTFTANDENGKEMGTIDFTAGISSQYKSGGFLTVKLNNNNSVTVTIPEVPTDNGYKKIEKTISFNKPIKDIVLGIGEVVNPEYIKAEAKLWLFIPVYSADIINKFNEHKSSRYGTYYGNQEDNNFYSVQGRKRRRHLTTNSVNSEHIVRKEETECQEEQGTDETRIYLRSYHYDLHGGGGNDRFFLGPQASIVSGDDGNDLYFVQSNSGNTFINNFALDEKQDTIFLNISHFNVHCYRDGKNLILSYCKTHKIHVKNWFVHGNGGEVHRHVYVTTKDGVVMTATDKTLDGEEIDVECTPFSVDKSPSKNGVSIILTGSFSDVVYVTGSNYSDRITGNDIANVIHGGRGDDYLEGKNGGDEYLINEGDGKTEINNFATDDKEDTLVLDIPYKYIGTSRDGSALVLSDKRNIDAMRVTLKSWYDGKQYRHMRFISSDYVRFTVIQNKKGSPATVSITVDLVNSQTGVTLDLESMDQDKNIEVNDEVRNDVKLILDSPFNDILKGNLLGNFISCSEGGDDYLQGNGGKDTYVINRNCKSATINNYDQLREFDLILFKCKFGDIIVQKHSSHNIMVLCSTTNVKIVFINWFLSLDYQHLFLKSSDQTTAFLPENETELQAINGKLYPFEIEPNDNCNGETRHIDLTETINRKVERFAAKTNACSYNVTGNDRNNYIDPGPGNPFGYQELKGGEGKDTYVIGHNYSIFNTIDNYATDLQYDNLFFKVLYEDIQVYKVGNDIVLSSFARNDLVKVTIKNYFLNETYQHLLVHSMDDSMFVFQENYPYIARKMMDFSKSPYTQIISAANMAHKNAVAIIGSLKAENSLTGGPQTLKIIGGGKDDVINGGSQDEDLIGLAGDDIIIGGNGSDYIFGGEGNDTLNGTDGDDVIYGGLGADIIDGGLGSDTIVLSGDNLTGVIIDLLIGLGSNADAEGDVYTSIENVLATEYDDYLYGNYDGNLLNGYGGSDYFVPGGGNDNMQGGTGVDYYDLTDAFGNKFINNFATDKELDIIIMNNTVQNDMCYFFLGDDMEISISFQRNTSSNSGRFQIDQDNLHITLYNLLRNTTNQHIAFLFSDGLFKYPDDFKSISEEKQLYPYFKQIVSQNILHISQVDGRSLMLNFNLTETGIDCMEDYKIEYVHVDYNITTYHKLFWPSKGQIISKSLTNLNAGINHVFSVIMTSCDLRVVTSSDVYAEIEPSPPIDVKIMDIDFFRFTVAWRGPSYETDPLSDLYGYVITLMNEDNQEIQFFTSLTHYTVYDLQPQTSYQVKVSSEKIGGKIGRSSKSLHVRTKTNMCHCTQNLSPHLRITDICKRKKQTNTTLDCDEGYKLFGEAENDCNNECIDYPMCHRIMCPNPSLTNGLIEQRNSKPGKENIDCSVTPYESCVYTWKCNEGYEVEKGVMSFTSTCLDGQWDPPINTCRESPLCTGLKAPANGVITSASAYVTESVEYTCSYGYEIHGPTRRTCIRNETNPDASTWYPNNPTSCIPYMCPELLPQPYGVYSRNDTFYPGDTVTLTCNHGYYIRNVQEKPEEIVLRCLYRQWNTSQSLCLKSFQVTEVVEGIFEVRAILKYSFSSWVNRAIDPSLYNLACSTIGGISFESIHQGRIIVCNRQYDLANGPDDVPSAGFLQVKTSKGKQLVCINDPSIARSICENLDYQSYTTMLYETQNHPTTLSIAVPRTHYSKRIAIPDVLYPIPVLVEHKQMCSKGIQCRGFCQEPVLPNGRFVGCNNGFLEGETCSFICNSGCFLIGSQQRTCTGLGTWTGDETHCDCKLFKKYSVNGTSLIYMHIQWNLSIEPDTIGTSQLWILEVPRYVQL